MQTRREAGTRYRSPYVSNRVPEFHLRRKRSDRQWEVPYADVFVDVDGHTLEETDTTVSALLEGTTPDLRVWLIGSWSELDDGRRSPLDEERLDLRLIRETFRGDARVHFVETTPDTDPSVPYRLYVPVGAHPTQKAVADLVRQLDRAGAGLLCAPLPGATRAGGGILRLERAGSFARAHHLEPEAVGSDLERVVERVAGTHWLPGAAFVVTEEASDEGVATPVKRAFGVGPAKRGAGKRGNAKSKDAQKKLGDKNTEELRRELERAQAETERLRARAVRAERKLRWSTPGLGEWLLRKVVR